MRSFLIASAVLFLGLASCRKEVIITTEPYKPPYRLSGLHNVDLAISPFPGNPRIFDERLYVLYLSGKQKMVSIKLEDLPKGTSSQLETETGYPDFNTNFTIRNDSLVAGNFTPRLILSAEGDSDQVYPFKIKVTGDASCTNYLLSKTLTVQDNWNPVDRPLTLRLLDSSTSAFYMTGVLDQGRVLKGQFNCKTLGFTIPEQMLGDTTFSGSGSMRFTGNSSLDIHFYILRAPVGGNIFSYDYLINVR